MPNWPSAYGHCPSDVVESTLDEAARDAGQYPNPTWFTATEQTKSRGRRGREWVSTRGNFFGTLSLPINDPETAALRSFVAALALYDAIDAVTDGDARLSLKWPNDVLLGGGKVAGILLETLSAGGRVWGVAVGIGVNLVGAPDQSLVEAEAVRPVSLHSVTDQSISPDIFLAHLAPAFAQWEFQLAQTGFSSIRNAWLDRASHLGEPIRVRLPNESLSGLFEGIDQSGNLILALPEGNRLVAAGDVYFGG